MARPFVSVIVPVFNEAKRLPLTLIDLDYQLAKQDYTYEVIIINDGSTDETSDIAKKFAGLVKRVKVIDTPEHSGKGNAVKVGMLTANGIWRLAMSADNSISVSEFNKILPHISGSNQYDIVIGSRFESDTRIEPALPIMRRLSENILNWWARTILRSTVKDFFIHFHCFSQEVAEKLFSELKLKKRGYVVETLIRGEREGYRIREVPLFLSPQDKKRPYLKEYLQIFWEVITIRWWLRKAYRRKIN